MRVKGPNGTGGVYSSQGSAKKSSGATFSLPQASSARPAEAARGAASIGSIDALLALQEYDEEAGQRRRKAMKKGHSLLDQLDDLKIAILSGKVDAGKLERLVYTLSQRVELSDSPELKSLLDEIELRAEVELAKLGHSQS